MLRYNGLDREPQYIIAPRYTGELPTAEFENERLYTGGCHCGAVTIAFKTQAPLPERRELIQECNCSICCRASVPNSSYLPNLEYMDAGSTGEMENHLTDQFEMSERG